MKNKESDNKGSIRRERQSERQRDRETERQRQRDRETNTQTNREKNLIRVTNKKLEENNNIFIMTRRCSEIDKKGKIKKRESERVKNRTCGEDLF